MEELDPIVLTCTEDRNTDKVTVKQRQQPKKTPDFKINLIGQLLLYCTVVQIRLFKHFLIFELLMTPGSLCGSCITCNCKNLLSKIIARTLWDNVLWLSTLWVSIQIACLKLFSRLFCKIMQILHYCTSSGVIVSDSGGGQGSWRRKNREKKRNDLEWFYKNALSSETGRGDTSNSRSSSESYIRGGNYQQLKENLFHTMNIRQTHISNYS